MTCGLHLFPPNTRQNKPLKLARNIGQNSFMAALSSNPVADAGAQPASMNYSDWYKAVLALVIWREARGEGAEGMRAVAHVIKNRVDASHLPDSWDTVIERKWQFSSMTAPGDPMLVQWPIHPDASFAQAMKIAAEVFSGSDPDLTSGATHYCNLNVCHPAWADTLHQVAVIGHHTFFR